MTKVQGENQENTYNVYEKKWNKSIDNPISCVTIHSKYLYKNI